MWMRTLALSLALLAAPALSFADAPAKKAAPDTIKLPAPADVKELQLQATDIKLRGGDESRQLILSAILNNGQAQDLTGDVQYEVADTKVARVTASGRVIPTGNGSTTITARFGERSVQAKVQT